MKNGYEHCVHGLQYKQLRKPGGFKELIPLYYIYVIVDSEVVGRCPGVVSKRVSVSNLTNHQ